MYGDANVLQPTPNPPAHKTEKRFFDLNDTLVSRQIQSAAFNPTVTLKKLKEAQIEFLKESDILSKYIRMNDE